MASVYSHRRAPPAAADDPRAGARVQADHQQLRGQTSTQQILPRDGAQPPKAWPALWTFAAHEDVQPTNNHAERALRSTVIYRKLSLGSQSEGGERRTARLLSVHTTCRLQARSMFAYLADALHAHARDDPTPLLT